MHVELGRQVDSFNLTYYYNDIHMDASQKVLSKQYQSICGWESTLYAPNYNKERHLWQVGTSGSFSPSPLPSGQIHYNGHSHWVFSFRRSNKDHVFVVDSLASGQRNLPTSMQMQLAQIYGAGSEKVCVYKSITPG